MAAGGSWPGCGRGARGGAAAVAARAARRARPRGVSGPWKKLRRRLFVWSSAPRERAGARLADGSSAMQGIRRTFPGIGDRHIDLSRRFG